MGIHPSKGALVMRNKKEYRIVELFDEINILKNIFDSVEIVDPITELKMECGEHYFKATNEDCSDKCSIGDRRGNCLCRKIISTGEPYTMFQFKDGETYYIMSRPIRIKNKDFVMILTSRITKNLVLGTNKGSADLVKNITKYSKSIYYDELTGAYNRKFLTENIQCILQKAEQEGVNVCVGCVDIDNFKGFNDTYGHAFGDEVLKSVTDAMRSVARREDDYVIRIGGDEFVIIMQGIDKKTFVKKMNECCEIVSDLRLKTEQGRVVRINISVGTSSTIEDRLDTYEKLSDKADRNLYTSKNKGKNCVT